MPKGNEIVEVEAGKQASLVARAAALYPSKEDLRNMWTMAKAFVASGMTPKGLDTPERVLIALQHGREIGLPPFAAVQNIAIINGRPSIYGDVALGLVYSSGLCEYLNEEPITDDKGSLVGWRCTAKRVGDSEVVREFTIDRAKKAGLWGKSGPWSQYPDRMLQMRARSWVLRDAFPDVLKGVVIVEDVVAEGPLPSQSSASTAPLNLKDVVSELQAQLDAGEESSEEPEPEAVEAEPVGEEETEEDDVADNPEPDGDDLDTLEASGLFVEEDDGEA